MEAHKHLIDWAITNGYVLKVEIEGELDYQGDNYDEAVAASEAGDIGCIVLGTRGYIPGNQGYAEYNFEYVGYFSFVHEYIQS